MAKNIVSKVGSKVGTTGAFIKSMSPTSSSSNKIKIPKNYMPNIKRKGGSVKSKKK